MAEGLKTLIRLHDWNVDEKRRTLGGLTNILQDLENQSRNLEQEIVDEQKVAQDLPETALYYGNYAKGAIERRQRIAESINKLEEVIGDAREEVREAHRELKKYEVAQENRQQLADEEENHQEQLVLDEQGLQNFRILKRRQQ